MSRYGPIVIRGRDFIVYRLCGGIAAILLLVALAVQAWELFDGDARTVPEVAWGTPGDGGSTVVGAGIADRTTLQDERFRTGPAPGTEREGFKVDPAVVLTEHQIPDPGPLLTEAWSRIDPDTAQLLHAQTRVEGISSLPYPNADLFERPVARDWRLGLADIATHFGALAILGFSFLLALILAIRGRVPIAEGRDGRTVKRFSLIERANHWMTSLSFLMLAVTGIVIAYGRTLILPFGEYNLGAAGWISTWGHMILGPSFALGIVVMAVFWLWRNLPSRLDLPWLARAGGFFNDDPDNPPARKFNAGQKLIFWAAFLGGGTMVLSGVALMFPFMLLGLEGTAWTMLVHALLGVAMIAIFIGHIYIGTVGMQGAFWAMWGGDVDRNWAKEHHDLWLAEIEGREERA